MKMIGYDFDGVFTNIEKEKAILFGETLHKLWGIDPELACETWIRNLGTSRRYKFDQLYSNKFQDKLSEEQYYEVENVFSKSLMVDYYPNATLVHEVVETAKDLNKRFDVSFISSGVTDSELKSIVSMYGIDQYFDHVFGTNHLYKSKVDHLNVITEESAPSLGIFIGDGLEDMRVAKQFNFMAIGIPSNHKPQALREAGADLISSPRELKMHLHRFLENEGNTEGENE